MNPNNTSVLPLEVRASSIHRLCTNKPRFDYNEFSMLERDFIETLEKKGLIFEPEELEEYCNTNGIKTKALAYKNQLQNRMLFEEDPLPEGAKTYIQEVWLQLNCGFYKVTLNSEEPKLLKGHAVENDAISLVGQYYNIEITKNIERVIKGVLTGECDVLYVSDTIRKIRDAKCPEDWASFRKKNGIETAYYWQLIAYCYLYDATEAYLDYILMQTPQEIFNLMVRNFNTEDIHKLTISNNNIAMLSPEQRIKTYELEGIQANIEFLITRLAKAEEYYNSLTYELCMNLN